MAHLKTACGPPVGHGSSVGNHRSSHHPLDHVDSSENFSNSVWYLAENRMRDMVFLSFETENWIRLLRLYLNFLCELNSIDQ